MIMTRLRSLFPDARFSAILFFGFISGLPFNLVNGTLQAWLAEAGISPAEIGLFTLIGLPQTLKFLWAPLLDRFRPPFLGRRRGWMMLGQLLLAVFIAWLGFQSPHRSVFMMAVLAICIMLAATTFDINYAGFRSDSLEPHEHPIGASYSVMGYRIAMLTSGALAMILSGLISWRFSYELMAFIMAIGVWVSFRIPEPKGHSVRPASIREAVLPPFKEFVSRKQSLATALFLVIFALGDCMEMTMTNVFYLQGAHFSVTEVGVVAKIGGSIAMIVGVLVSAKILSRLGMYRTFWLVAAMQQSLHLLFLAMSFFTHNYALLLISVLMSNITGSMNSVLWSTYMIGLCDVRYPGTQYAMVSAMAGSTRILSGPLAGFLASHAGWAHFFLLNILFDAPGWYLLYRLRQSFSITHAERSEGLLRAPAGNPAPARLSA